MLGNGLRCPKSGSSYDGYCIGSVASSSPDSCATIFSEYSHPIIINSKKLQEAVYMNLNVLPSFNLYKMGLMYNRTRETFAWLDGTDLMYHNFPEFPAVEDTDNDICVALDQTNSGNWKTYECNAAVFEIATICQFGKDKVTCMFNLKILFMARAS